MSAAIVRQMLDTLNGEGTEAALAWFAEDFHGVVPPELSAEPDTYDGHDGVRHYFDSFHEIVADLRFDAEELVDVGSGRGRRPRAHHRPRPRERDPDRDARADADALRDGKVIGDRRLPGVGGRRRGGLEPTG